jgi:hypothetical protein
MRREHDTPSTHLSIVCEVEMAKSQPVGFVLLCEDSQNCQDCLAPHLPLPHLHLC